MRLIDLYQQSLRRLSDLAFRVMCCLLRCYKWLISPLLPLSCRFYPSCSEYAISALEHYGLVKGLWMALKRLLRCHPWADGGFDPVLPNKEKC